jgi:hypothetical protein
MNPFCKDPRFDDSYSKLGVILSYGQMFTAVLNGLPKTEIMNYRSATQPVYIFEDLYNKAVQELWEENELVKTKLGRLIYV